MSDIRLLPFERAVSAIGVMDVQIAPDGTQVAFATAELSRAGERPTSALWLVETGDGSVRPLASGEANDTSPRWSPDGTHLAFLSDRQQRGVPQLSLLSIVGGEVIALTNHKAGVSSPAWSPDGSLLAYLARAEDATKNSRAQGDDARVVDRDEPGNAIWLLAPADATPTHLPTPRRLSPEGMHIGSYVGRPFTWSPDSRMLVALTAPLATANSFVVPDIVTLTREGEIRRLGAIEGLTACPVVSPDGTTLALIAAADEIPARFAIQMMPVAGGERRTLAPDYAGTFHDVACLPDGGLLALTEEGQQNQLRLLNPANGTVEDSFALLLAPGTIAPNSVTPFSLTSDGHTVAFTFADAASVDDVYVADRGGAARRLTDLNPWTTDYDFGEMREITWSSFDGTEIQGLLILPVGYREGERYPLLTHIHGGPAYAWTWRLYAGWHDWGQFLAQRGYAVFLSNPRGSTGRGRAFLSAIAGCYGEIDWQDIMTGVDMLIDQGIADPNQLVVGGWSGGGFLTDWTITHTDRFKAAVSGAGPANWVSFRGTTDARFVFDRYAGSMGGESEYHWRLSPVRYAERVRTPTLFLHGERDVRVPVTQGYEMYRALERCGVETAMVVYPREGHGPVERQHQLDVLRRVVAWYDQHLGRTGNDS